MLKKSLLCIVILCGIHPTLNFGLPCNGNEEFCNRRYNEIAQIETHNSTSTTSKGIFALPNLVADQNNPLEKQLADGIRAFKIPVHPVVIENGKAMPWVTHTLQKRELFDHIDKNKKLFPEIVVTQLKKTLVNNLWKVDTGNMPLVVFLTKIKNYLDKNPREIITLFLNVFTLNEMREQFLDAFKTAGLKSYMHIQALNTPWPTLGEMINNNKRLVVFIDAHMHEDGFHYTRDFVISNNYNFKNINELNADTDTPHEQPHALYKLNHFITPNIAGTQSTAKQANKYSVLKNHIKRLNGIRPNFIHVNFYDIGFNDLKKIVNELNQPPK